MSTLPQKIYWVIVIFHCFRWIFWGEMRYMKNLPWMRLMEVILK